ncbi:uncharacterized protein STEHIDRAFT_163713 [Stereum hirsutum FP-91666 SS1]|uniref:Uncharacterized protein n=1 Tax=Stereum hirsutum (strain FP-91666) TaxID=721885 RepID=R7RVV2_STEHR|nr:uncharacterized protein STEHIDRAFT_163713 [Stereum hirsutum FP-91666 SS1]EIM79356.1 hypothetical protein STEHIDRAFT_163713 [Stereum hirsutum FP-91666 SS1]
MLDIATYYCYPTAATSIPHEMYPTKAPRVPRSPSLCSCGSPVGSDRDSCFCSDACARADALDTLTNTRPSHYRSNSIKHRDKINRIFTDMAGNLIHGTGAAPAALMTQTRSPSAFARDAQTSVGTLSPRMGGDSFGMYARVSPLTERQAKERELSNADPEPAVVPEYSGRSLRAQNEGDFARENEDNDTADCASLSNANPGGSTTPMFNRIQGSFLRMKLQSLRKVSTVENLRSVAPPSQLRIVPPSPFHADVDIDVPESVEEHEERMRIPSPGEKEKLRVPDPSTFSPRSSSSPRSLRHSRSFSGWLDPSPLDLENDVLRALQHLRADQRDVDEELDDAMCRIRNAFHREEDDDD